MFHQCLSFCVGSRILGLHAYKESSLLAELYLQSLHPSNQEAKGKKLGVLEGPQRIAAEKAAAGGRLVCELWA